MKITTLNNAEIVIQARDDRDFRKAQKVAKRIEDNTGGQVVRVSECEIEQWVQLTACWYNYQAAEIKDQYQVAKKELGA